MKKKDSDTVCLVCGLKLFSQNEHETTDQCCDALIKENKRLKRQIKRQDVVFEKRLAASLSRLQEALVANALGIKLDIWS